MRSAQGSLWRNTKDCLMPSVPGPRAVRIQDVASRAGVSIATVSNVVNNTRYVSPEARRKVRAAIVELDYRPSAVARSLRRQETLTIAAVFPVLTDFFTSVLSGIEDVARRGGYTVIVANSDENPDQQERYLEVLSAKHVDGMVIAFAGQTSPALQAILERRLPVVFLDRRPPSTEGPVVGVDNAGAAREAVEHLLSSCGTGHVRVGMITGLAHVSTSVERERGYREALAAHSQPVEAALIKEGHSTVEGGRAAMHALLALPPALRPSAVFAANNRMTIGARLALQEAGLACPDTVGLFGFDDHQWAMIAEPPLSVVRQPTHALGQCAAELLLALLQGNPASAKDVAVPHQIVVRASCSPACADRYRAAPPEGMPPF